jgi:hypothetical protein
MGNPEFAALSREDHRRPEVSAALRITRGAQLDRMPNSVPSI